MEGGIRVRRKLEGGYASGENLSRGYESNLLFLTCGWLDIGALLLTTDPLLL